MEALSIEIVNPKAKVLLRNLAAMDLIHIKKQPTLTEMMAKLRRNEAQIPSLEEITQEVELVRQMRYAEKTQDNH